MVPLWCFSGVSGRPGLLLEMELCTAFAPPPPAVPALALLAQQLHPAQVRWLAFLSPYVDKPFPLECHI